MSRQKSRTDIMLCYPFEESRFNKWAKPILIQPKIDGDRCRAVFDEEGKVTLYSSEANVINSVPHINKALEEMGLRDIELDGELYKHGVEHAEIHGIVSRTINTHPDSESIQYKVFDVINGHCQIDRLHFLTWMFSRFQSDFVRLVEYHEVKTIDDCMEYLEKYIKEGYEGIILRSRYSNYERKRSTSIMKYKPYKSDMYRIVGYNEEMSIHNEPKGTLGALILQSDEGEVFNVGSGPFLTREMRECLWKEREKLVGRIADLKYQSLTKRKVARFPVLMNIL